MKKYKSIIIIAIVLVFCGILGGRYHEEQKMLNLHHTYEVSLAKALKNSYKDIEEIHFKNPVYSDKPGSWSTDVVLVFTDKTKIEYQASHSLSSKTNYSASIGGKNFKKYINDLRSRFGKTNTIIKIYFSNKEMEEIK